MKPMMKNTELISQAELYPKSAFPTKAGIRDYCSFVLIGSYWSKE